MKVTTTRPIGGHDKGATINVTPMTAQYLIDSGNAEEVKETKTRTRKTSKSDVGGTPEGTAENRPG